MDTFLKSYRVIFLHLETKYATLFMALTHVQLIVYFIIINNFKYVLLLLLSKFYCFNYWYTFQAIVMFGDNID